jgi:hypothetical protein
MREAAKKIGSSERFLRSRVADGLLKVYKVHGRVFVTPEQLREMFERASARRRRTGRGMLRPEVRAAAVEKVKASRAARRVDGVGQ